MEWRGHVAKRKPIKKPTKKKVLSSKKGKKPVKKGVRTKRNGVISTRKTGRKRKVRAPITKKIINKKVARKPIETKRGVSRKTGDFYSQKDEIFYKVNTFSQRKLIEINDLEAEDYRKVFNQAMKIKTRTYISLGAKVSFKIGSQYFSSMVSTVLADAADADLDFLFSKLESALDKILLGGKSGIFSETTPKITLIWSTLYER